MNCDFKACSLKTRIRESASLPIIREHTFNAVGIIGRSADNPIIQSIPSRSTGAEGDIAGTNIFIRHNELTLQGIKALAR